MKTPVILPATFQFLNDIKENNNREWFEVNKPRYQEAHLNMIDCAELLLAEMNKHDHIETLSGKKSLHRIYRDIRFSKNKTPYKNNLSGGFRRATQLLRGGYYFHVQPGGNSFVGGGFWGPNSDDLKMIRRGIEMNPEDLREVIADPEFISNFGELAGNKVKTAPRGIAKDHPDLDLLRYKQFVVRRFFTDKEVLSKDFIFKMNSTFKAMRPFFDYMSEILTTDGNGIPIY